MKLRAAVIVLAGVLAYANGLSGQFMFDDENSIVSNRTIRAEGGMSEALSEALSPPKDTPVAGRPLVNFTFALNYAASGLDVRSYRSVNLAIHLLVALVFFGIVRRTLLLPKLRDSFGRHALNLSFACALVWVLHPLNSETVNYLSQRTESLMALFFLLTVYFAIRAFEQPGAARWPVASVASAMLGMLCKESMVTVPAIVLLYDRVFLFGSLREAFGKRWRLYAGLAASWLVLAALMSQTPRTSTGFGSGTDPWTYFLNQIEVITRYLVLTVWPRDLVIDYGVPRALTLGEVAIPAVFLIALGIATLAALWYRPLVGFLLAWFFITLSPTSSFVPIATEVGAERRMYLPLAGIVVLAVLATWRILVRLKPDTTYARPTSRGKNVRLKPDTTYDIGGTGSRTAIGLGVLTVVCALLATGTFVRNREYRTRLSIAQANVERRPHGRARFQLGTELIEAAQHEEAMAVLRVAIPDYPAAHYAIATELLFAGNVDEAITHAREFIRLMPNDPAVIPARDLIARGLISRGQVDEGAAELELIVQRMPGHVFANRALGDIRSGQRRFDEAIAYYQTALKGREDPDILGRLGVTFANAGRMKEAIAALERAAQTRPTDAALIKLLGRALASEGRFSEAVTQFRRAVELAPADEAAKRDLAAAQQLTAKQGF